MTKAKVKVQIGGRHLADIEKLSIAEFWAILNRCDTDTQMFFDMQNTTFIAKNDGILGTLAQYPNCKIRIRGGLNEDINPKYSKQKYQERTIYTPSDLQQIITKFEKIEAKINPAWSDLAKSLYVYVILMQNIEYGEMCVNGIDVARNLNGILHNKLVCVGFALTYKEILNRIGIGCRYVNKANTHSWNEIKIDGKIYPVDLTWDCSIYHESNKKNMSLSYFGTNKHFYENPNHQTDTEQHYPTSLLTDIDIKRAYTEICTKPNISTQSNLRDQHHR